jgi:hypothetical protein
MPYARTYSNSDSLGIGAACSRNAGRRQPLAKIDLRLNSTKISTMKAMK